MYPTRRCADEVHVKEATIGIIEQCANSTEGSKLLQKMGEETNKLEPPLESVPTITFKALKIDAGFQNLAVKDFQKAICSKLSQPVPIECRAGSTGTTLKISGSIIFAISALIAFKMF